MDEINSIEQNEKVDKRKVGRPKILYIKNNISKKNTKKTKKVQNIIIIEEKGFILQF